MVSATFLGCKELTRLMRQEDDWVNSAVGGALSGSMCAVAFKGRAYSASGALLFASVAGGIHYLREADATGNLYKAFGFKVRVAAVAVATPRSPSFHSRSPISFVRLRRYVSARAASRRVV